MALTSRTVLLLALYYYYPDLSLARVPLKRSSISKKLFLPALPQLGRVVSLDLLPKDISAAPVRQGFEPPT